MSANDHTPRREDIFEAASERFLRLKNRAGDPEVAGEIEAWLDKDPAHREAFEKVEAAWGAVGDNAASPEMVIARRDALERAGKAAQNRWTSKVFGAGSPIQRYAAAVAILVVVVSAVLYTVFAPDASEPSLAYETAVGETRVLTLEDNSRISLDAGTHLEVTYTDEGRSIELYRGQAYFDVAKDPLRPFKVKAGDQTVVALGTEFNVEMINEQVLVTLVEGRVSVTGRQPVLSPDSSEIQITPMTRELEPGQQLVISREKPVELVETANLEKASSWRQGKLIFEDEALSAAVERMNRYSHIKIIVGDKDIEALGISGVFNAGDTEAFVEALELYFELEATRGAGQSIRLTAAS